jgi:hypothetical protein
VAEDLEQDGITFGTKKIGMSVYNTKPFRFLDPIHADVGFYRRGRNADVSYRPIAEVGRDCFAYAIAVPGAHYFCTQHLERD